MNKILLTLTLLLAANLTSAWSMPQDEPVKNPIEILPGGPSDDNDIIPRTPDLTFFECYYSEGKVYLLVSGNVGEYTLCVTELSNGTSWTNTSADSGLMVLPTDSAAGYYQVVITTASGNTYYGYYTL